MTLLCLTGLARQPAHKSDRLHHIEDCNHNGDQEQDSSDDLWRRLFDVRIRTESPECLCLGFYFTLTVEHPNVCAWVSTLL